MGTILTGDESWRHKRRATPAITSAQEPPPCSVNPFPFPFPLPARRAAGVGELLNHTSGLPSGGGTAIWGDGTTEWFVAHARDSTTPAQVVVADALTYPQEFAPGTAQQYNGLNTFLAGMVVEKVNGRTMAEELTDHVLRPLGLHHTSLPAATDDRLPGPYTHGYLTVSRPDGGTREADVTEQSPWPWAEGGMISTTADLDRFITALVRGEPLPPAQQRLLFTVPGVPSHDNANCPGTDVCFSTGLMSAHLPDGQVAWGRTGSRPGYTSGVFATRDLRRKVAYSITPTGLPGAEAPTSWASSPRCSSPGRSSDLAVSRVGGRRSSGGGGRAGR